MLNLSARIIPTSVVPVTKAPEAQIEAMAPRKKRRSESPHVKEAKPKKKKGRLIKELTTQLPTAPPPKSIPDNDTPEEDYDDPNVITRKRKSVLRLSGGKSAKKAKSAAKSGRVLPGLKEDGNSDEESSEEAAPLTHESTITTIKNGEHLDHITNPNTHRGDHESRDRSSPPRFLPLKYLELSVAEYEIPSTVPQGPGGLWTCTFEGCHARVHQAGTESGQDRVKEHLKTHIVKDKIDLVLDESRPYLPVE